MRLNLVVAAVIMIAASALAAMWGGPAPATAQEAGWHNRQMLHLSSLKPEDGWLWGPGGLRYRRVRTVDGPAPQPSPDDIVTLHYSGSLIDGTVFDSSIARGEPASFPLKRLIKGWQLGVPLMKVGETFEFAFPHGLAYGPKGKGPIPGGATLMFTVELIGIEPRRG